MRNETQPNFGFISDNLGIQNTVNQWGKLLGDFNSTPWHQKIKQDPQFIQIKKPLNAPKPLK
jgi:hypothetical protein